MDACSHLRCAESACTTLVLSMYTWTPSANVHAYTLSAGDSDGKVINCAAVSNVFICMYKEVTVVYFCRDSYRQNAVQRVLT